MSKRRKKEIKSYHFEELLKIGARHQITLPKFIEMWGMQTGAIPWPEEEIVRSRDYSEDANAVVGNTMLNHYSYGQQTFDLSSEMVEMFMRTDLQGVCPDDLKLPYPGFYVGFPKGLFELWSPLSGWHECNGVYVREPVHAQEFELEEWEKKDYLPFVMVMACHSNNNDWTDNLNTWVPCTMASEDTIVAEGWKPEPRIVDFHNVIKDVFEMPGSREPSPLECMVYGKSLHLLKSFDKHASFSVEKQEEIGLLYTKALVSMARIVFNLLIYLNHGLETKKIQNRDSAPVEHHLKVHEKATSQAKKKNAGEQATRLSIANVHSLSHAIKGLRTMKATDVLVRGHWRTYWIGKGRKERLLKWIQPFIRNPDTGIPGKKTRKYLV